MVLKHGEICANFETASRRYLCLDNQGYSLTLRLRLEGTFARKNKKIAFFLGFLLAYSYLCPRFWRIMGNEESV